VKHTEGPKAIILETVTNQNGRVYDQVRVVFYDLHLCQDIRSERDERLAYRMARDYGIDVVDKRG
jgi:hypothetical protein